MAFEQFDDYDETLKEKRKACLIAGWFFLVILVIFFCVGCFLLARQIQASRYVEMDSVVVDYKLVYTQDRNPSGSYSTVATYFDVVEYEINGQKYQKTCDTTASRINPPNNIGNVITIYVNPNNPKDVVFRNSTHILLTVVCLSIPTIGFVVIGFVFRYAHKIKEML